MLILVGNTTAPQSLQIVLTGAPAAELAWMTSYVDFTTDTDGDESVIPTNENGTTAGTTPVDIITAPEDGSDFQLKGFYTKNQNAADVTVIIRLNDNSTSRELIRVTLAQHDTLEYIDTYGFKVIDANGNIKVTSSGGLIVEEDDLNPSYSGIGTLQFEADDFVVSQPAGGVAKITSTGGASGSTSFTSIYKWGPF